MKLLTIAPARSPEWLAARAGKISASTAASILCPGTPGTYSSPLGEFTRIKRELEEGAIASMPDDDEDADHANEEDNLEEEERLSEKDAINWGLATEDLHAQLLERHSGLKLAPAGVYQHESLPWLVATPDRFAIDKAIPDRGVAELKALVMRRDSEETRYAYLVQSTVQMLVTKLPWGLVSHFVAPKPRWHRTELSSEMEEFVITGLTNFWERNVMRDIPPEPTGSDADLSALKALYPQSTTRRIVFSMAAIEAAQSLEAAKAAIKECEAQKKEAQAVLLAELEDAEAGILPDGTGYTYKTQISERKATEAKTLEFRVLRKVKRL